MNYLLKLYTGPACCLITRWFDVLPVFVCGLKQLQHVGRGIGEGDPWDYLEMQ